MTDRSVEAVRKALLDADPEVRAAGAGIAGDDVLADLAPDLRAVLDDGDPGVRRAAARGLAAVHAFRAGQGDEVALAVAGLRVRVRDPDLGARRAALAALGLIGDPVAAVDLAAALDDPAVADLAEEALREWGPAALPASEVLAVVVRRGGEGADAAARVLLELGPSGLPVLGRLLDEDEAVDRVLDVLPALGVWAAPLVGQIARHAHAPGDRGALAARALVAIGPDAFDDLAEVFDGGRPEVRAAALSALDLRGQPDLVGLAVRALFDEDARVRVAALSALSGAPDAARPFRAEIGLLADDPDRAVRAAATSLAALVG